MVYIAFLRAINVGGRVIKMADLVRVFEAAGLKSVKSFLASGNVLFEAKPEQLLDLEETLESTYLSAIGHDTQVFVRSCAEIGKVAERQPFPAGKVEVA